MAKMHSKKQGKSKSRKPVMGAVQLPQGIPAKAQIVEIITGYAKQGMSPQMIGLKLKTEHNVPYIKEIMGQRLVTILKEKKLANALPYDMLDLMKKAVNMRHHMEKNKQDASNKLRLSRTESKIWRLSKYYMREGVLPNGWRYDPKQAELLIKGS
ncbi:MAG TPA: 30S ribosomal protein S15 [Candidatus Acidoferrales bacterium]|nr:30S ribosomal protein S15 [Candidatus Acidoferrales bacterium]